MGKKVYFKEIGVIKVKSSNAHRGTVTGLIIGSSIGFLVTSFLAQIDFRELTGIEEDKTQDTTFIVYGTILTGMAFASVGALLGATKKSYKKISIAGKSPGKMKRIRKKLRAHARFYK